MARKYDSSRRAEAAQKTKEAILEAAFHLHGRGVLELEALAVEANVSLATVRKYFPTREELYFGCTSWGMRYALFPDMDAVAAVDDAEARLREGVVQAHRLYESLFGQFWMTYVNEMDSPILAGLLQELDATLSGLTELLLDPWPPAVSANVEARGLVRGLLSFLTYYALVREGGLVPERATDRIAEALLNSLRAMSRRKEATNA
jgi:AcrR family transcriptional regulator